MSQLRQPLGAQPLQTQLANDVLFKNTFFGPATVGLHEFNPLFVRDDLQFQIFGFGGNQDTYGDQAVISGLNGPVSFSLGQLATETDGYRPNNDNSVRQYTDSLRASSERERLPRSRSRALSESMGISGARSIRLSSRPPCVTRRISSPNGSD